MGDDNRPMFGVWIWHAGVTLVLFRRLFQIKRASDEMWSQRNDTRRLRFLGLSVKLFG